MSSLFHSPGPLCQHNKRSSDTKHRCGAKGRRVPAAFPPPPSKTASACALAAPQITPRESRFGARIRAGQPIAKLRVGRPSDPPSAVRSPNISAVGGGRPPSPPPWCFPLHGEQSPRDSSTRRCCFCVREKWRGLLRPVATEKQAGSKLREMGRGVFEGDGPCQGRKERRAFLSQWQPDSGT